MGNEDTVPNFVLTAIEDLGYDIALLTELIQNLASASGSIIEISDSPKVESPH